MASEADILSRKVPISGWSANGILTTPVAHAGSPNTFSRDGKGLALQAELKDSGYYSVQFSLIPPPGNTSVLRAEAEVTWSVQGNSIRRILSVQTGTVISGTGQAVNVKVYDVSEPSPGVATIDYLVSVNIAKGTRPTTPQPPTFYSREIINNIRPPYQVAGGGFINITVPADIGINQFLLATSQFSGSSAQVGPNDLTALVNNFATFNYSYFNSWQPLAPGATSIIVNNNTADLWFITPIWGIEG